MSRRILDLPIDIPWKLIAVSPDMMDTTFGNKAFPFAFRSSVALSAFEPRVEDLPDGICAERITYLKISASITGYQPTKEEIDQGYAQFPNIPTEDLNRILREYFACYGALLNVAVFPRRTTVTELTEQCDHFQGLALGMVNSPLVRSGVSYARPGQPQIQVLDTYPLGGDGRPELNIAEHLVVTFPACSGVSATVAQRAPAPQERQDCVDFATLVPGSTVPNPFVSGGATFTQRDTGPINVVDRYPVEVPDGQGELDLTDGLSVRFPACHRVDAQIVQGKPTPLDPIRMLAFRAGQQVAVATAAVDGYQTLSVTAEGIDQVVFQVPRQLSSLIRLCRTVWQAVVPLPVTMDAYAGDELVGSGTAGVELGRADVLEVAGEGIDRVVLSAPSGNAALVEFCRSVPSQRPVALTDYPHIVEFEPKTRDLYQSATLQGEVLTASRGDVRTDKSMSHTESTQTGLSLSGTYSSPPTPAGSASVTGSLSHSWGETNNDSFSVQADNSRERRERTGTATNLSQMYNLLTGYHVGTNRATFMMLPRPHMIQPTDHRTFIKGLRMIEGVQEFFLVVRRPVGMDGLCVEMLLDTGHFPEHVVVETPPPEYEYGSDDFVVSVHANSGVIGGGECKNIHEQPDSVYGLPSGWVVDRSKGDPAHPGVSELEVRDNQQSLDSLRGYGYRSISDTAVQVFGTICGAGWGGPGAIFDRTYRAFRRSVNPKPGDDPVVTSPFFITTRSLLGAFVSGEDCPVPMPPIQTTATLAPAGEPTEESTVESTVVGQPPSVVDERRLELDPVVLARPDEDTIMPAVKELLRNLQFRLATSWRAVDRRPPGTTGFLETDYVVERISSMLPEEVLARPVQELAGVAEGLGAMTVGEAARLPLAEFARRTGLGLAEAARARTDLLRAEVRP